MRKTVVSLALFASIFMVSGCDFFRKMAGRPTSAEIEAKRELIEREQHSHQQRLDSVKVVQQEIADSLDALESSRLAAKAVVSAKPISEESRSTLSYRYYIIVGAFSSKENADNLCARIKDKGYDAEIINYRNGFNAVGVCPSDDLNEVLASLDKITGEDFCPADAWVLEKK